MKKKSVKSNQVGKKLFVALARVSSREQKEEGFSLEVQEEALYKYAQREDGEILKLFKIAETASKQDERKTFKEMIAYVKANALKLDGILVHKFDRIARNIFDFVELERIELDYDVNFTSVSQPTDNTPTGRMLRRMLGIMAAFYTDQQSVDVRDGLRKRVESGLFVGLAPYGYRNVRPEKRSLIEVDQVASQKVKRVFDLYAYENCTIDMIVERMAKENIPYTDTQLKWPRSKVATILRDRAYIGEVKHNGQWHPGTHRAIVDRITWGRVQVLMGDKIYKDHQLTFAGELIKCGHCGRPITGEATTKKTTGKEYVYYRCVKYTAPDHPRVRLPDSNLDDQVQRMLGKLRQSEFVRDWFGGSLRYWAVGQQDQSRARTEEIQRQLTSVRNQQKELLTLRLLKEIEADTFAEKQTEFRDRIAALTLELEAADRASAEQADFVQKVFELSQNLRERWVSADHAAKRQILELVCLNFTLDGVTLVPQMRSPFDLLIEGLNVSSSRGDKI